MLKLNHMNLPVPSVPDLTRFFVEAFEFRLIEQRGNGNFSVLVAADGFVLILLRDKKVDATTYPAQFHVGFRLDSKPEVIRRHRAILDAGFDVPQPNILDRGGYETFGFYCKAPGGVTVEVSTPEIDADWQLSE